MYVLPVFATDSYNYENDIYKFWDVETPGIYEKALSCFDNYLNSKKKLNMRSMGNLGIGSRTVDHFYPR